MDTKKAIAVVTYDDAATAYYFLIFHNMKEEWVLPKTLLKEGEDPTERVSQLLWHVAGIRNYKITSNMQVDVTCNDIAYNLDTYLVQASMNSPITLAKEHYNNYLWSLHDRAIEKLTSEDKTLLLEAMKALD
ncbi:MAG: hypothetical protein ACQESG_07960 [Nanobdellota archaeon]